MDQCQICAETYSDNKRYFYSLKCCNSQSKLCYTCLYSHVKSILEEGITGDGRKKLLCPYGCGSEILDSAIRESIHRHHSSPLYELFAKVVTIVQIFLGLIHPTWIRRNQYKFFRWSKSSSERRDLQLYDRWSLTVALSSIIQHSEHIQKNRDKNLIIPSDEDSNQVYTHILHCPRPDCECLWLTNRKFYKQKLKNEQKYNKSKTTGKAPKGLTKTLLMSASNWLFFNPIQAHIEEDMMNECGYTTAHWMSSRDIDIFSKSKTKRRLSGIRNSYSSSLDATDEQGIEKDGRRVTCPKCEHHFCGICSRPWTSISRYSGSRVSHTGRLCGVYSRKIVSKEDDDFLEIAQAGDARCCPGCSIRTNRTHGCNHMTCPCGYQWCYVCGCRWTPRHYSCADSNQNQSAGGCITS